MRCHRDLTTVLGVVTARFPYQMSNELEKISR